MSRAEQSGKRVQTCVGINETHMLGETGVRAHVPYVLREWGRVITVHFLHLTPRGTTGSS